MQNRRWFSRWSFASVAVCSAAFLPALLSAQSKKISTEELLQRADIVAHGKVQRIQAEWNADRTMIRSMVTLGVEEYLKGDASGTTLTLEVPGGEVGGVGELYTHMPVFKQDEEVVVFAHRDRSQRLRVTGGEQGKIHVSRDERTGEVLVGGKERKKEFVERLRSAARGSGRK